jgi:hypothetical protein
LLFDRVGPDVGPFDPGNCLIFTTALYSAHRLALPRHVQIPGHGRLWIRQLGWAFGSRTGPRRF